MDNLNKFPESQFLWPQSHSDRLFMYTNGNEPLSQDLYVYFSNAIYMIEINIISRWDNYIAVFKQVITCWTYDNEYNLTLVDDKIFIDSGFTENFATAIQIDEKSNHNIILTITPNLSNGENVLHGVSFKIMLM